MTTDGLLKLGRRWLYIIHRWIGIFTCILCAVWFVSGVVMAYVPFPGLTDRDRMAVSQPIDWSQVQVSPTQAMATAGLSAYPGQLKLTMLEGRPVYRINADGKRTTISAVDGRSISGIDAHRAVEIVRRLHPDAPNLQAVTLVRDQWTVAGGFNAHRPLHKVSLGDAAGTELYVSSATGEVVDDTHRSERFWNWVGSIPHWIYFTVIRQDNEFWRQVIMWTSGPALIGCIAGIWVGILRLRLKRRYAEGRVSPYRGWMKWHHISGLIAGLFLTTWMFSGWLSVNPFHWFERESAQAADLARYAGQTAPRFDADPAQMRSWRDPDAREARFIWLAGRPLVATMRPDLGEALRDGRTGAPVTLKDGDIFAAAAALQPGTPVDFARRLTAEDLYWYAHQNEKRMPVLRVGFDNADATWFHIDPTTGEILGQSTKSVRTYRWLFNFLHDFDLPVLLHNRPVWDIVIWGLSIGGLIISISGVVVGWRRLVRKFGHAKPKPKPKRPPRPQASAAE